MKAARLHAYHDALKLDSIDEPKADGPFDVIVRIGAAGLCRTDLHIQEGQWAEKSGVDAALHARATRTPAGSTRSARRVTNVEVGDTVIVHPYISCGLCLPCRVGDDMHCLNGSFPGIDRDGGFADLLKTSARSVVKLDPAWSPRTSPRWPTPASPPSTPSRRRSPSWAPGTRVVVIGAGGLGHIGIQCLKAYTPGRGDRHRPVGEGAGAGRRDGRRPDREGRRHSGRHRQGDDRRLRRRGDHRLRGREGRDRGRDRDGPRRRLLLRDRLRREHRHPHDRRHQPRDLVHRQPRRHLRRPVRS